MTTRPALAADPPAAAIAVERFVQVLEKNPRRGTAFDRVYGYHVENGTLDNFVAAYRERVEKKPDDGAAWMIVGLVESQRGNDAAAAVAFRHAEEAPTGPASAPYYLGQSLILIGRPDEAARAFERAIDRKPGRNDLLEIFQALGRLHQRARRDQEALAVWNRVEQLFPDDLRVQEQIAATLAEEGRLDLALKRYEALAKKSGDDDRRVRFGVEAAQLKVGLGRTDEALRDFEQLLSRLNPDHWLHRDVRRRIEQVFLKTDDQAGLARYYERWLETNRDDVDVMARLGRILAGQGKFAEARAWIDKALKLAPGRKELRLVFIRQLTAEQRYADAIEQYEILAATDPANPDNLREWGRLLLKDANRPEAERRALAAAVWKKIADSRPSDSTSTAQAADLFRQAGMTEEALAHYRRAVELSPASGQFREYLGEYLHSLKRSDQALAEWRQIASGKRRTAASVARLAEVLSGFGYAREAGIQIVDACRLDAEDFILRLKAADLLGKADEHDAALGQLDVAGKLATTGEESEAVLAARIKVLQASNRLRATIDRLARELKDGKEATAEQWYLLARYQEAASQPVEAARSIASALALDDRPLAYSAAAARIAVANGRLLDAADAYRRLAGLDRRQRAELLARAASLEAQLGRPEMALDAGRAMLASAPGDPERYQIFAGLCFRFAKFDEGFDALRRAARLNPTDPRPLVALAAALAEQGRENEAIETLWKAFEIPMELERRLEMVRRLAELHLQTNQLEKLTERLARGRRESGRERDATICLAASYETASDFGAARRELERLLDETPRDVLLLERLSQLAEREGDYDAAIRHQQELLSAAPSAEAEWRLATLWLRGWDVGEGRARLRQLAAQAKSQQELLAAAERLVTLGEEEVAVPLLERLRRESPDDWQALYRLAATLAEIDRDRAAEYYRELLSLRLPENDAGRLSTTTRDQNNTAGGMRMAGWSAIERRHGIAYWESTGPQWRMTMRQYGATASLPADFGEARVVALAWFYRVALQSQQLNEFIEQWRPDAATQPISRDPRRWTDWLYVQRMRGDGAAVFETARELMKSGAPNAPALFLVSLPYRTRKPGTRILSPRPGVVDQTAPLAPADVELMLDAFRALRRQPAGSTVPARELRSGVEVVATELRRADRNDDLVTIADEIASTSDDPATTEALIRMAAESRDAPRALVLFDRWAALSRAAPAGSAVSPGQAIQDCWARLIGQCAKGGDLAQAFTLWDRFLRWRIETAAQRGPQGSTPRSWSQYKPPHIFLFTENDYRGVALDFPWPNRWHDYAALAILRNLYEVYRREDAVSDLVAKIDRDRDAAAARQQPYWQLARAYIQWWNDDRAEALDSMNRALEMTGGDLDVRLDLVGMHQAAAEYDRALALLDSIPAADARMLAQIEMHAFRLAALMKDPQRMELTASRLSGLRLASKERIEIATELRRQGLVEQADAMSLQAAGQAGRSIDALRAAVSQALESGKSDSVVDTAFELLRRTKGTDDLRSRLLALQVLNRAGKLDELIRRAEERMKAAGAPEAQVLELSELYSAAGKTEKLGELQQRVADKTAAVRATQVQLAQQRLKSGRPAEAADAIIELLRADPRSIGHQWSRIGAELKRESAGRLVEFLLDEFDLEKAVSSYGPGEVAQSLIAIPETRDQGWQFFRKVWDTFPENHDYLVACAREDAFWDSPQGRGLALEVLIEPSNVRMADPWSGAMHLAGHMQGHRLTVSEKLVQLADGDQLKDLASRVTAGLKETPYWYGGEMILAQIRARQGKLAEARELVEKRLDESRVHIPAEVRWYVGANLEQYPELRDLVVRLYEGNLLDLPNQGQCHYPGGPIERLVEIYADEGRLEDARRTLAWFPRGQRYTMYDFRSAVWHRSQDLPTVARRLRELGFAIDAARVVSEFVDDPEVVEAARTLQRDTSKNITAAVDESKAALEALSLGVVPAAIDGLFEPVRPRQKPPHVSLAVMIDPRSEEGEPRVISLFEEAARAGDGAGEVRERMRTKLAEALDQQARDLVVRTADAVLAGASGDSAAFVELSKKLAVLVDETPLEDLRDGARPSARQREAAAQQLGLWLVARRLLADKETYPLGVKLGRGALDAARRQLDTRFADAITRAMLARATAAGDEETAAELRGK